MIEIEALHAKFLECSGVSTDTRSIVEGQMYFALKGPNFNGNHFVQSALDMGARYVVIDEVEYHIDERCILVNNVLGALQDLARHHRSTMNHPVFALTGSNGKTTTKELLFNVMANKFKVSATKGNFNNHIGVPLTILRCPACCEFLIVEMGANQPGDISELCEIAQPDFGLITNIGASHLEKLGSKEGVYQEKISLYRSIVERKGVFFLNIEDQFLSRLIDQYDEMISYNSNEGTYGSLNCHSNVEDGRLVCRVIDSESASTEVTSQLTGQYNKENISAALSVGHYWGLKADEMLQAIGAYLPQNMRSQIVKTERNNVVLDAYNANPSSMKVSIENVLGQSMDEQLFILGDMLELGELSRYYHQGILNFLIENQAEHVILIGSEFAALQQSQYPTFVDSASLIEDGRLQSYENCTVLIKGSRGIGLEKLMPHL